MDVPVSGKARAVAKQQAQKEVPEAVCPAEVQVTSHAGWKATVATFPHTPGAPAEERHTPFLSFIRYESFFCERRSAV